MPKTPVCSPLKRGPSQRFPPSLLISYVESPTQQSYVTTTEVMSDSDVDDESEDAIDDTKRECEDVHITPKAPEVTLMRISDADTGGGATTSPKDPAAAAENPKFSVASRFQSARQALADARRRSFQLGEWSLSATFQHMRSYSSSSVRCADSPYTVDNNSSSNNNNNAPVSPISSNQAEDQQGRTDPEARRQQPKINSIYSVGPPDPVASNNQQEDSESELQRQQQQQQQKKKREPRICAVSYQSALAKYLPTMFSRAEKNTRNPSSQVAATMEANDGSCDTNSNGKKHLCGSTETAACDNNGANAKRTAAIRAKRLSKWILRTRPPSQKQSEEDQEENKNDNQREHEEGEYEDSLRPAARVKEQVGCD